jgi:hypothetical protein
MEPSSLPRPALSSLVPYLTDKDFRTLAEAGVQPEAVFGSGSSKSVHEQTLDLQLRDLDQLDAEAEHELAIIAEHVQELRSQEAAIEERRRALRLRQAMVRRKLADLRNTRAFVRSAKSPKPGPTVFSIELRDAKHDHVRKILSTRCVPAALVRVPAEGNTPRPLFAFGPGPRVIIDGILSPDTGYIGDPVRITWPDRLGPIALGGLRSQANLGVFRELRQRISDDITFFQRFIDRTVEALDGHAPKHPPDECYYISVLLFLMLALPYIHVSVQEVTDKFVQFVVRNMTGPLSRILPRMIPDLIKEAAEKDARSAWVGAATSHLRGPRRDGGGGGGASAAST